MSIKPEKEDLGIVSISQLFPKKESELEETRPQRRVERKGPNWQRIQRDLLRGLYAAAAIGIGLVGANWFVDNYDKVEAYVYLMPGEAENESVISSPIDVPIELTRSNGLSTKTIDNFVVHQGYGSLYVKEDKLAGGFLGGGIGPFVVLTDSGGVSWCFDHAENRGQRAVEVFLDECSADEVVIFKRK